MHAGGLGTFLDAVGSLFWIDITNKQYDPNKHARLAKLNSDLKSYYGANPRLARLSTVTE